PRWGKLSSAEAIQWASRAPFEDEILEVRQVFETSDFPSDVLPPEEAAREEKMHDPLQRRGAKRQGGWCAPPRRHAFLRGGSMAQASSETLGMARYGFSGALGVPVPVALLRRPSVRLRLQWRVEHAGPVGVVHVDHEPALGVVGVLRPRQRGSGRNGPYVR